MVYAPIAEVAEADESKEESQSGSLDRFLNQVHRVSLQKT